MPEARVNGARIWYKETGEGDPVVQKFMVRALVTSTLLPLLPSSLRTSAASILICADTVSRSDLSNAMIWRSGRTT